MIDRMTRGKIVTVNLEFMGLKNLSEIVPDLEVVDVEEEHDLL